MKTLLFCFMISVMGVTQLCQALTCTPMTGNMCTKSLYVTGKCVAGVCECVKDTVPTDVGCHSPTYKPTVSGKFPSGDGTVEEADWSGEASGNYMKFKCNPSTFVDGSYSWFRNGIPVKNAHRNELQLYVDSGTWRFQCTIATHGSMTDKSDAFVITVNNFGVPFTVKPVVAGIPKLAARDSGFFLSCNNVPSFMGAFVYTVDGVEEETLHHERSHYIKMTDDKFNKQVTCTVKPEGQTPSITSDPVFTPATPTDDIPDVVIKGKHHFYANDRSIELTCEFMETFAAGDVVTYKWKGPNPSYDLSQMSGSNYFKLDTQLRDAGMYSCAVTYKNKTKVSPDFEVTVEQLGIYSISAEPEKPVIGGYISLRCSTYGTALPSPQYKWNLLVAHPDNVVQINNIKATDFGQYVKCGTDARNVYGHVKYISAPIPMSDAIQPMIEVDSVSGKPDSYVMSCKSEYHTPGTNVEWFIDDVMQKNKTFKTFSYSQSDNASVIAMCRLSFNSKYSESSRSCTIPGKGSLATPVIQIRDSPTVFITGASYAPRCSCLRYSDATYTWKKGGVPDYSMPFESLWQGVDNTRSGNYTCTVTLNGESKESEPFEFIVVDKIPAPKIEIVASPNVYETESKTLLQQGSTYYLHCSSPAHQELARYSWRRGNKTWLGVPDNILRLHDVSVYDREEYRCTMDLGGKSVESEPLTIDVGDVPSPTITTTSTPPFSFTTKVPGDGSTSMFATSISYTLTLFLAAFNLKLINNLLK